MGELGMEPNPVKALILVPLQAKENNRLFWNHVPVSQKDVYVLIFSTIYIFRVASSILFK